MSKKYPLLDDKEWLEEKYLGEMLCPREIAEIIGCHGSSVSRALKGFGVPMRTRSEANRGERSGNYGKTPWNKDKHLTDETKQKMSDAKRGKKSNHWGKHTSEETKQKLRESSSNPSEETRRKMSEAHKKNWQDPDYIKKVFDGLNAKPNELEMKVGIILQKHLPDEYAYNGDFSCGITIGGKIPDFVNVNGEKIVIEVFGPWHDEIFMRERFNDEISWKRTEFGTKAHYSQFGYKCVVFWQEELEREDAEEYVLSVLRENKII